MADVKAPSGEAKAGSGRPAPPAEKPVEKAKAVEPMKRVVIAVDPGHGDRPILDGKQRQWMDSGAVAGQTKELKKLQESQYVLTVSKAVTAALKAKGFDVTQTREGDMDNPGQKLQWRLDVAKAAGAGAFVSIHMDAVKDKPKASGMLVLFGDAKDKALAQNISDANTVMGSRGISHGNQTVLGYSGGPSVIVELGFITNESDRKKVEANAAKIAEEIADGIAKTIKPQ